MNAYRQTKTEREALQTERRAQRELIKRIKANQRKINQSLQTIAAVRAQTNAVLEQAEALLEKIENERIDRAAEQEQNKIDFANMSL